MQHYPRPSHVPTSWVHPLSLSSTLQGTHAGTIQGPGSAFFIPLLPSSLYPFFNRIVSFVTFLDVNLAPSTHC